LTGNDIPFPTYDSFPHKTRTKENISTVDREIATLQTENYHGYNMQYQKASIERAVVVVVDVVVVLEYRETGN
jgi:hypothetical protein